MKTKKSTAFWVVVWYSFGCVALVAWKSPEQLSMVIGMALTAVTAAAATYQGANVADNFQRSRNFVPELHEGEK